MLFAQPTPASAQTGSATPIAAFGKVWELGYIFQSERTGALGTALRSVHFKTAVRPAFHGWLAGRRPESFLAGRKGSLGTVPLSLSNPVVRAASGWLSARTPGHFPRERTGALGTALLSVHSKTAVRPAFHGWLAGRRPEDFLAGRMGLLGTVPLSLLKSVVRAASGWLSARTAENFPCEGPAHSGQRSFPFIPKRPSDLHSMAGWQGGGRWIFSVQTPPPAGHPATISPCSLAR